MRVRNIRKSKIHPPIIFVLKDIQLVALKTKGSCTSERTKVCMGEMHLNQYIFKHIMSFIMSE